VDPVFDDKEKTLEKEFVEDLLAIVTLYAGKFYDICSHRKNT